MTFALTDTLAVLERTPATLRALLSGLPEGWLRADEGPGTWSPFDVVGHLIDGEELAWLPRLTMFLDQAEDRPLTPVDRTRVQERNLGLDERLDTFARLRAASLAAVRALDLGPEQLARTATHPEFGTVRLSQFLATWSVHDLGHVGQIVRVMSKRYADAVGPWGQYLSILHR